MDRTPSVAGLRSSRGAALLVLASLWTGCLATGTGPQVLEAELETWSESLSIRWLPPARGQLDGYVLEWRVPGGAFQGTVAIGADRTSEWLHFGDAFPDASDVEVRVRALPDPKGTRATSVIIHVGPRPPAVHCAGGEYPCTAGPGGFRLALQNRSPGASALVLQRMKRLADGRTAAGPSFTLPADATSFVDALADDWDEEATYAYEVVAVTGGERSVARSVQTRPLPLLAPTSLTATVAGGDVTLSFEAPSRQARCYQITVTEGGGWEKTLEPCVLPPAAGARASFVDAGAAARAPYQLYRVVAHGAIATSAPAEAWVVPGSTPGFSCRVIAGLPAGVLAAARLRSGGFAVEVPGPLLHAPGPAGSVSFKPHWTQPLAVPALVVGPSDRVEAVGFEPLSSGGYRIAHARFDGTSWSDATLSPAPRFVDALAIEVGLDGVLRAAWDEGADLVLATFEGSRWRREVVAGALSATWPIQDLVIAADAEGVVHLAHDLEQGTTRQIVHRWREGGAWSEEVVPGVERARSIRLFVAAGRVTLVTGLCRSCIEPQAVHERVAGTWSAPEPVSALVAGRALDGAAIALASHDSLWVRDGGSARRVPRPPTGGSVIAAGVGPSGKGWVLDRLLNAGAVDAAVLCEEL